MPPRGKTPKNKNTMTNDQNLEKQETMLAIAIGAITEMVEIADIASCQMRAFLKDFENCFNVADVGCHNWDEARHLLNRAKGIGLVLQYAVDSLADTESILASGIREIE